MAEPESTEMNSVQETPKPEKKKQEPEKKPAGKKQNEKPGITSAAKSILNAVFPPKKEGADLPEEEKREKTEEKMIPARKIELDMLDETEIKVYNRMKPSVPVMPESLTDDTLDVAGVLSALTVLELAGAVESGGSGYFMRIQPDDIMQSPND